MTANPAGMPALRTGPQGDSPSESDPPRKPDLLNIAVLVSGRGRGTNFQAIQDACVSGFIPARVALLVSTTPDTPAMDRARAAGVEAVYLRSDRAESSLQDAAETPNPQEAMDGALLSLLESHDVGLICLAGFMRKVGPLVRGRFENCIMNVHPSLIPAFAGNGMYGIHVHEAVLAYGVKMTGVTVQFIDEEYDSGPIILQWSLPVEEDDTPQSLAARVLVKEHAAYVEAIRLFAQGKLRVEGRRVRIQR